MTKTYADYLSRAHAEFMYDVVTQVVRELHRLAGPNTELPGVIDTERTTLRVRGLDAAGKPLSLVVRLIPINEFKTSVEFLGSRGDTPSVTISELLEWRNEEFDPSVLASIIMSYLT